MILLGNILWDSSDSDPFFPHTIEVPDVKAIREQLGLSQHAFASAYRIPLATLKGWEQGRRQPDATASAYLAVIARLPVQARDALRVA